MISFKLPKITCVTVTKDRPEKLKKSINCYLNQSYSNKNMVIVSQSKDNKEIQNYLRSIDRSDISFFVASPDLNLGTMRNTSVEIATGDIICQWDDDDLYHPDRLMLQYNVLRSNSSMIATAYCDFLKYFENTGDLYWCDWSGESLKSNRFLCGTIMFYKKAFSYFDSFYPQQGTQSIVEEDLNVIHKLLGVGEIGQVWSGWHYFYVYHGNNTYNLDHHNLTLDTRWGKKILNTEQLIERKDLLKSTFQLMGIDKTINVRSKDEIAFVYA